jgi:hypothetical protein
MKLICALLYKQSQKGNKTYQSLLQVFSMIIIHFSLKRTTYHKNRLEVF